MSHLDAVSAALAPLGYKVWLHWAAEVTGQYLVVSGKPWDLPEEMPAGGLAADFGTDLRIKAVTGTPDGVVTMLTRVRELLSPQLAPTRIPLAGHVLEIRFARSEFVDVDRDTTITATGRHPAIGVDTYRLNLQPA